MSRYLEILANQRPFPFNVDENGRTLYSANYRAMAAWPVAKWEEELIKVLSDAGLATLGADTWIGPSAVIPGGAGPFMTVIDTGGVAPIETHDDKKYERLSAQVVVRALDSEVASIRALAIWRTLDGLRNVTVAA